MDQRVTVSYRGDYILRVISRLNVDLKMASDRYKLLPCYSIVDLYLLSNNNLMRLNYVF